MVDIDLNMRLEAPLPDHGKKQGNIYKDRLAGLLGKYTPKYNTVGCATVITSQEYGIW